MNERALEVKKHVGIIHCSNKLTLLQRKLSNALLYHAYDNLLTQEIHEIKIGELACLVGYDSHDYDTVKKALKFLMTIVLEWNLLKNSINKDKNDEEQKICIDKASIKKGDVNHKLYSWHASTILASASIDGSMCRYSYSPELKKLLYMPEIYGKINLVIQSRFKSTYALALYENCVRYKNLKYTGWILLDVFRKLMGVSDDKYNKFKDFKRRVLDKAIQEINESSDICVIAELQQYNQKTVAVRFKLSKNQKFNPCEKKIAKIKIGENEPQNYLTEDKTDIELNNILREEFNVSQKKVDSLLIQHDLAYIWNKVNLVKNSVSYKDKKIKNIAAYFLSALKDDFQAKINVAPKPEYTAKEYFEKIDIQAIYRNYQIHQIQKNLDCLDELQRANILQDFEEHISNGLYLNVYKKEGLKNILISDEFLTFVQVKNIDVLTINILSFVTFCEKHKSGSM